MHAFSKVLLYGPSSNTRNSSPLVASYIALLLHFQSSADPYYGGVVPRSSALPIPSSRCSLPPTACTSSHTHRPANLDAGTFHRFDALDHLGNLQLHVYRCGHGLEHGHGELDHDRKWGGQATWLTPGKGWKLGMGVFSSGA